MLEILLSSRCRRRSNRVRGLLTAVTLVVVAGSLAPVGSARAALILLEADVGFPGDPGPLSFFTLAIDVNGSQPDENPAVDQYLATHHGDYDGTLDGPFVVPLTGTLTQIASDAAAGTWQADFQTPVGPLLIPTTIVLNGIGLVGDQSLPLFSTFTGGTVTTDGSALGVGVGTGPITRFVVPEPGTGLVLATGLVLLALQRRR